MRFVRFVIVGWLTLAAARMGAETPDVSASPCSKALAEGAVCEAATERIVSFPSIYQYRNSLHPAFT